MKSENHSNDREYKLELMRIPVLSMQVSCGLFGIQDDNIENYLSLDEKFILNKHSTFIFRAIGDSMLPRIESGDFLIVDRSINPKHGNIIIADIFDERVCKQIYFQENKILLKSFNTEIEDLEIFEEMNFQVFGVVTLALKDLSRGIF